MRAYVTAVPGGQTARLGDALMCEDAERVTVVARGKTWEFTVAPDGELNVTLTVDRGEAVPW